MVVVDNGSNNYNCGGDGGVDDIGSGYAGQVASMRKYFLHYGRHITSLTYLLNLALSTILGL